MRTTGSVIRALIVVLPLAHGAFTASERSDLTELFAPKKMPLSKQQYFGQKASTEGYWTGSDSSASIKLNDEGDYLWLWGDTLFGMVDPRYDDGSIRRTVAFLHSSLGMAKVTTAEFGSQSCYYPATTDGVYLPPKRSAGGNERDYYWLIAGVMGPSAQKLFIQAQVIRNMNKQDSLGFEQVGSDIIVVEPDVNSAPPNEWTYVTTRLPQPSGNRSCFFNHGISAAQEGGFLYMMGQCDGRAALSRVLESDLANEGGPDAAATEVLLKATTDNSEPSWGPLSETAADDIRELFHSPYTEGSLFFHETWGKWYVLLLQAYDPVVRIAFADELAGEWTVEEVYEVPGFFANNDTISYAAKAHPEYFPSESADGAVQIVFSYNTNHIGSWAAMRNTTFYHPQFVQLDLATG